MNVRAVDDAETAPRSPTDVTALEPASASASTDAVPASRLQHLMPATLVLLLGASVTWISFTAEPAPAFVFPRLIALILLVLAGWNFTRAALGLAKVGSGVTGPELVKVLPGLAIMLLLCFVAARWLGFYTGGFIAFVALYAAYDPAPHTALRSWLKRLAIGAGFMAVIYALFAVLLKVQTPRGLFF